ncbi:MAG TPA: hypothetical protein VMZ31_08650 [Phycisphaerae bacterium]|nr:hypothetical protein [Phycisphaerae bacterium]
MWQLLRRDLIDSLLFLVLALLLLGIAFAGLAVDVYEQVSAGWDHAQGLYGTIAGVSLVTGTVGWVLAYLLGQSQARSARWRGLTDHVSILPVRRLTIDLVRTIAGLALLLICIGLPVGVVLAWMTIADVRPLPLYWDEAVRTWAYLLSPLLPAYAGGLCFGRGSIWRALLGVPVVVVLEWYCRGQAVMSVELARLLAAGALLALVLLAGRPRTTWPRRIIVTALVVLVWQTPLAMVRASLDRSPSCLWGRAAVVLDGAGNPHAGSGERIFWQFAEALIPAHLYVRSSAGRTHAAAQWRWWLSPRGPARSWLERQSPAEPPGDGFDFQPSQHPALRVRLARMYNPWSAGEPLSRSRLLWLGWSQEFPGILWGPGGYQRLASTTNLVYPNHRTGLLELHELSTDEESRRVRRIVAYAGRHEIADTDQIDPFPPGTIGLPGKTSVPLEGTMHGTLVWLGPDATVEVNFANRTVAEVSLGAPNSPLSGSPRGVLQPGRWGVNVNLDTGRFYFRWSPDAVGGDENDDALWRTDWPEALARARMDGELGPPTVWSAGRIPTAAEAECLFWRVQPDDLGRWYEVTVPGPWCPFVNLVQFTPLLEDGSPAGPVRTAQVWVDPERRGNWAGFAGYVGGYVLATLSSPAVLLSSLVMPPAYTPQEWQQCVLQEPLVSACLDTRFDDPWAKMPGVERRGSVKQVRIFMASIATPILVWSVAIGSLLGWHVKRRHRPHQKRPGEARRWFLAVLLLGIPGWIVYRIYRPREALVNCPRCGRLRSPATITCPFCNAPWTPAQRLDSDIIHVESPAVVQPHTQSEAIVPTP